MQKTVILCILALWANLTILANEISLPSDLIEKLTFTYSYESGSDIEQMQSHIDYYLPEFNNNRAKAIYLNRAGFDLYAKQIYPAAMSFFYYAMNTDSSYRYPFYNFVCSKALLDRQELQNPCFTLAPNSITVNALTHAIRLYPGYKEKMLTDPDLESYRNLPWFLHLSGLNIYSRSGCIAILEKSSTWFGNRPGIYPTAEIDFYEDGIVQMRFFSLSHTEESDFNTQWILKKGTYKDLAGGQIIIHLEDGTEYLGEIRKEIFSHSVAWFYLVLTDDLGQNPKYYCVYPDPCSA